jgi:predicted nucleic acid-binding protein
MTELCFFDTNVLLYMFDRRDHAKRLAAVEAFRECIAEQTFVISTQVVQEFYVAATRKLGVSSATVRDIAVDLCALRVIGVQPEHVLLAIELKERFGVSFWDALILAAAQSAGAGVLFTEDLNHGQHYNGVKVVNPFISPVS